MRNNGAISKNQTLSAKRDQLSQDNFSTNNGDFIALSTSVARNNGNMWLNNEPKTAAWTVVRAKTGFDNMLK